ncbi:type 1 glutamine amidotransferase domain-containing protein [Calycomorphotria hydatis]|uniref:Cysteine protease YraA n=1 Tax=Calycomorphotria hydatis TaxID=2528027 RepID=A0A517TC12_9PLAN|nr:type 1 glutamine amidotransferase domain-containing protein [Calycomorphotria hydatis]QDT65925.1 Putative cysteine protease YraA [Calycomorphotria hydatis]
MHRLLEGQKILILAGPDYEDLELWYPKLRLEEAGAETVLAGLEHGGETFAGKHGYPCKTDVALNAVVAAQFDGIVIPGGWMPDKLRRYDLVLNLVRHFHEEGKLIAAICHGGWIPISAGVYKDVKVTGSPGIKDDLINAGAIWEDSPVVVDRHFVSSRRPGDLPQFMHGVFEVLLSEGTE